MVLATESAEEFDIDFHREVKLNNSEVLNNPTNLFSHLSKNQAEELRELLEENITVLYDVPKLCSAAEHDVSLINGASSIKQTPYRLSPVKQDILNKEVQFLLDNGLVEKSNNRWASPCILVQNKDGGYRMCTDYRKVNTLTHPDRYSLPRIDEIIDSIGKCRFVSKLDLLKGYYHVPFTENAKEISAFATPQGLYQYTVLPFGMRNAPATFQRMMDIVLPGLNNVKAYIVDIVIYSDTWDEHLTTLKELFQCLDKYNLTVNLSKSEFGKAKLIYLGHIVGNGKISPNFTKVNAISQLKVPTSRKEIRFLGMCGFYRKFCPNFSIIAAPLTGLISPKNKFVWTNVCQEAFRKLQPFLISEPVLPMPNLKLPFILQVDASDSGVGGVLLQKSEDDILHPVTYFPTKLKPHQKRYSTIEKETLALLTALEKFSIYLDHAGPKILVYSDHNPLKFVNGMKNKNARLLRSALALQPYDLEIRHIL